MRHLLYLPLLLVGCKILTFPVAFSTSTQVDGAGLFGDLLGALDFTGFGDFDLAFEDELANQGVAEGDVTRVELTRFELAAEPDLAFLESIAIYVEADGFPRTRVASADSFPPGEPRVALNLDPVDLTDAIVAPSLQFSVEVTGSAPSEDRTITADLEASVEATLQGACRAISGG
jgi:hypothetical protein